MQVKEKMRVSPSDDYRVYVDTEANRVVVVFCAGDVQMTVNVNGAGAQKLIDALSRAVQQLEGSEAKHQLWSFDLKYLTAPQTARPDLPRPSSAITPGTVPRIHLWQRDLAQPK